AAERFSDKDWNGFFNACVDDPVIEQGHRLVASISDDFCVVILTARIHETREKTVAWLSANGVRHDWLILRGHRQGAPSTEWKREQLEQLQEAGADIELALDDDPRNIAMLRDLGLTAMYVHSGYYGDRDYDVDFR
ncbi:MAG: HAD family acid phosphatase, partial [Acidimicrobiales bacterium]